jgi:hypothetical protein
MTEQSKYDDKSKGNTSEADGQNGTIDYKAKYEEVQAELGKKEKEYTGLQGTVQKKDDALKEAQGKLAELTGASAKFQSDLEKLMTEKETLSTTLTEKEIALVSSQTEAARAKLIMKEFPELAIFESKGLLPQTGPDDDEAKLKELFGNFKTTMDTLTGTASKQTKDNILAGGSPKQPDTTSGAELSGSTGPAAAHLALAQAAALAGDMRTYDKEFSLFQEAKYKNKPLENS